jgi:hypothetical protein
MEAALPTGRMALADVYEDLRARLFAIAYRMLEGVAEAEHIVRDIPARLIGGSRRTRRRHTMTEQAPMPGELIYEQLAHVTAITEYGVAFDELVSGTAPLPAEGARFDAFVEGTAAGPKLNGVVKGVDYLHVRADGRIGLHYHAEITTEDDKKIALEAHGVLTLEPGSSIAQLRNNVVLTTAATEYAWLNPIQIWAPGTVDLAKREIRFNAYAA